MRYFRKETTHLAMGILLSITLAGCNGSSNSNSSDNLDPPNGAFPSSKLFLDFSLPFSELDTSLSNVSGITLNVEEDYFLASDKEGRLLSLTPTGEVLDETFTSSFFTGVEFIEDGQFILSEEDRLLSYDSNNEEIEELFSFIGKYENIQSIAYNEDTQEIAFVNNGDTPVLVYVKQDGSTTEFALDTRLSNYAIDGLQLSDDYLFMGSSGFQADEINTRNSIIIQTELDGTFFKAWELDEKILSGLAVLDEEAPRFITTNLGDGGSFNTYEPEALPSMASEQPLEVEESVELGINQPSGIDYLDSNNTFYFITDFGEVRSLSSGATSEVLFEIDAQQGSYEAIAAAVNNDEVELHILNSDDSLSISQIETYNLQGERLEQFLLTPIEDDHLFESLDFDPSTGRYHLINSNDEARKYFYTIDNGDTEILELPSSYDDFNIAGLDYSANNGYLYFVTQEFGDQNGNNAGLLIIYDTANAIEVDRYSIIDTTEPTLGVESPSGVALILSDGNEPKVHITSDTDDSTFHIYTIEDD